MSEELEAALATISAELSATQQLVTMLPVQHSLDRSRTEPSRAIDELEREFARILAELSDGAANAVDKQHFPPGSGSARSAARQRPPARARAGGQRVPKRDALKKGTPRHSLRRSLSVQKGRSTISDRRPPEDARDH
ncbi:hypothetical protein [Methylorubrum suomiense]|uniref:hypothetical protein n=1 Tax=Methylorubrum suomiense TaxID=144191 RepID=UPI0010F6F441|nr:MULTISPECIES: hypothetical protein [Methylobacteriaceae]